MVIMLLIVLKILIEMFINLGTNLELVPATGIPLPLMSAGGTVTIMTYVSLGIVQSIMSVGVVGSGKYVVK
jgi:cell division protein FtsW (lipid II flippase)